MGQKLYIFLFVISHRIQAEDREIAETTHIIPISIDGRCVTTTKQGN